MSFNAYFHRTHSLTLTRRTHILNLLMTHFSLLRILGHCLEDVDAFLRLVILVADHGDGLPTPVLLPGLYCQGRNEEVGGVVVGGTRKTDPGATGER